MRIGLVDVDYNGRFPNIPLMKISAYHKSLGDSVEWYAPFDDRYDIVYISKVFSFSKDYDYIINADKVIKGGTGYAISLVNGKEVYDRGKDISLPIEIETQYPDYSLYPTLTQDTAYGFLTRGCPRGCDFCHVASKEGLASRKIADLNQFWSGQKNIVLCDPNILACKDCRSLLQQLINSKAMVDFNQGLDIRLMTPEKAEMLSKIRIKEIHFAWDKYEDKNKILPKLKLFAKYSNKPHSHFANVYTLVNFDTTFEQDLERIYILRELGYWAYVMVYDKEHCDRKYKDLQRWVNNRIIFAKCEKFEDYKPDYSYSQL
jgi:hypothetical protein